MKKAGYDIGWSREDKISCEARNFAAHSENQKRLRAAEGTAKWVCPGDGFHCKWTYTTVALAEEEDCSSITGGDNHTILAARARSQAQLYKEQTEGMEHLVGELTIKLEDARARSARAIARCLAAKKPVVVKPWVQPTKPVVKPTTHGGVVHHEKETPKDSW